MPCFIQNLGRASDASRGAGAGLLARTASKATVLPRSKRGARNSVHGLFRRVLAVAVVLGVALGALLDRPATVKVEFGARIVVKAEGKGLGTMAKAVHPSGLVRYVHSAVLG